MADRWAWLRSMFTAWQPRPRPGSALCVRCSLNGGGNLVMDADDSTTHLREHVAADPGGWVSMRATFTEARHG